MSTVSLCDYHNLRHDEIGGGGGGLRRMTGISRTTVLRMLEYLRGRVHEYRSEEEDLEMMKALHRRIDSIPKYSRLGFENLLADKSQMWKGD